MRCAHPYGPKRVAVLVIGLLLVPFGRGLDMVSRKRGRQWREPIRSVSCRARPGVRFNAAIRDVDSSRPANHLEHISRDHADLLGVRGDS